MAKKITNIDISTPVVSREKYLEQQRQQIIDAAIQNSYDREFPEIPYTLKFQNENKWREYMEGKINDVNNLIKTAPYEGMAEIYRERLKGLEAELAKGYTPELCEGPTCIYTTTGNFGKQYQVAGNRSFRGNPAKYGFVEIGINEIKPGDVIQDFSKGDGIPTHALMFVGFDSNGKALYNYSDGRHNESAIQKDAYYPFINSSVHLTNQNSDKLKHAIAAYRFIGNEEDNINWNSDYNIYRQNYTKQLSEQMKNVPVLNLPKLVENNLKHNININKINKFNIGGKIKKYNLGGEKDKPITYEMTTSAAKAINATLNTSFFTPVTGREEQEGIDAWEPLNASESSGYLPDPTSKKGQSLINKWAGKAIIGSMSLEEIEALPRDYTERVIDRIKTKGLVGEITRGQNAFANKAFEWGVPAMMSIAGLGPTASLITNVGWLPTAGILGGGIAGSYGLSTGLGWLGRQIDERNRANGKYSNYEAVGSILGGIGGGFLGGWGANRALYKSINKSHINRTNFRNLFTKDYVDDALSFYHKRQLKELAAWKQRMAKPTKYKATVKDTYPQLNTVDDALITYKGNELPEYAFISKPNPLDKINIKQPNYAQEIDNLIKTNIKTNRKVYRAISRNDYVTSDYKGNINGLRDILIKEGVDPDMLTRNNLIKLSNARVVDYLGASNTPNYYAYRTTSESNPTVHDYTLMRGKDRVGYIDITDTRNVPNIPDRNGVDIDLVKNLTQYPESTVPLAKGVSEQAYNAVIGDLGEVRTGLNYWSADASTKVVSKYPIKRFLGNIGNHFYKNTNTLVQGPAYDLLAPTYRVPVKYLDMFGVNGIDDNGYFIVDFNKDPMYKYGGTVKPKSNKKMLGAAIIGAASSLIGTGIQAASQRKLYEQQQADQRKLQNIQNTNAMINNLNQQANNNMDWAYDKFKPTFKLGGTQSKFKNRF